MTVPILIHLDGADFLALERIAQTRGVAVRTLIEVHVSRSLHKKDHTKRRSRGDVKAGNKRPWVTLTYVQQAELVHLTSLGWSLSELADRYGCSTHTISNWRRRLIPAPNHTDGSTT